MAGGVWEEARKVLSVTALVIVAIIVLTFHTYKHLLSKILSYTLTVSFQMIVSSKFSMLE